MDNPQVELTIETINAVKALLEEERLLAIQQAKVAMARRAKELAFEGLQFIAPQTIADSLALISDVAFVLDFFLNRTSDYNLFMLLTKTPDHFWTTITKHVGFVAAPATDMHPATVVPLSSSSADYSHPKIVLEAIGVFTQGLEDLEIPDIYLYHVEGVSRKAVQGLVVDLNKLIESVHYDPNMPASMLGELLGKAFTADALMQHTKNQGK